jgi:hypothetical protein
VGRRANEVMKTLRGLIAIFIVVAVFYVGSKVVPVYFDFYQFQDSIAEEARVQSYSTKSVSDIRETVWKEVKQLDLPIASPDDLKIERTGNTVSIEAEYTVHIDVPIHPFDLKFTPSTKNKQI